jgi:hypothetical protein
MIFLRWQGCNGQTSGDDRVALDRGDRCRSLEAGEGPRQRTVPQREAVV